MRNSILTIVTILVLTAGNAAAQHFEWVRGFASGENVAIVGSVTDSVGNLYILGSINAYTSWENGSRLMPDIPYSYGDDHGDVLIAKISPDGDLVWYKVIHGNYRKSAPHDIKPLGDTAFACLVSTPLASIDNYLYYLDTLIRPTWNYYDGIPLSPEIPWPDYPLNSKDMYRGYPLALITFDFDGNVLEQHFLHMTYLDRNGEDILFSYPAGANPAHPEPYLYNHFFEYPSFAIDSEGNIYLSHKAYHYLGFPGDVILTVEDGDICAVKFWCDNRVVGVVPTDSTQAFSPQILKFSPHFETMLSSRYVFHSGCFPSVIYTHLEIDRGDRIYFLGQMSLGIHDHAANVYIDSALSQSLYLDASILAEKGFIVRYSPSLIPEKLVCLQDSIIDRASFWGWKVYDRIGDLAMDYDSNIVVVACSPFKNVHAYPDVNSDNSYFYIDGVRTDFHRDVGFMVFDMNNLQYKTHGKITTENWSFNTEYTSGVHGNIVCKNNRIFIQSKHYGSLIYPDSIISAPSIHVPSLNLNIFDYQGNSIAGIDYQAYGQSNINGPLNMYNDNLYLINRISEDATFGDISVPSRGRFFACIAKYTDPAFMNEYERPRDTTVCVTVEEEELTVVRYPNPTTGRLTIDMKGRPLREAWVAAMDGVAEPLPVTALGGGHYAADLSGRPDGSYILVLVSDDQRAYRATVILQR